MKTKFKINPDKIYKRIGQVVVYTTLYVLSVAFCYWGFLQGMTY